MDSMHGKFLGDVQKKSCPDVSRKKTRDRTAEIVRIPYDKPVSGLGKGQFLFGCMGHGPGHHAFLDTDLFPAMSVDAAVIAV